MTAITIEITVDVDAATRDVLEYEIIPAVRHIVEAREGRLMSWSSYLLPVPTQEES